MVRRTFWIDRIERAWRRRSVVWLAGVRRVGKTVLSRSIAGVEYFDCELPRTRRELADPEAFLQRLKGKRVVLDEVHRLANPSELLKIAADHFPTTKVIATGSSSLAASARFSDTLAGRKAEVWLTPMMSVDLDEFGAPDLTRRLRRGGLPPFFLAEEAVEGDYQEWMDSFWARDIQELFRLERRSGFQRFVELLLANSGGIFEATRYATPCEISRTTVTNYLGVLAATRVAHVVRPFSSRRSTEIVTAPKVYGFDTGFVCYHKGWDAPRPGDLGVLWEHFVLNELHARAPALEIRYWRDKRGHEVDFVVVRRGRSPVAVECKWSASRTDDLRGLAAFAQAYPRAERLLVATDVARSFSVTAAGHPVECVSLPDLIERIAPAH
jgi:predicted AAA+ superfamily ATPase